MSWFTDIYHAFLNGVLGEGTPSHDESKPLGAALNVMNTAATGLGQTLQNAAVVTLDGAVATHTGGLGVEATNLLLEAIIAEGQKRLAKPVEQPPEPVPA